VLIAKHRETRRITAEAMSQYLKVSVQDYLEIESGRTSLEQHGPQLMRFAENVRATDFKSLLSARQTTSRSQRLLVVSGPRRSQTAGAASNSAQLRLAKLRDYCDKRL